MSYSQIPFPPGVRRVKLRWVPVEAYWGDILACAEFGGSWYVWDRISLYVVAVFHSLPNVHGWRADEAHAKSMVNRADPVDIAALDSIP